jgi:hypothetical protein
MCGVTRFASPARRARSTLSTTSARASNGIRIVQKIPSAPATAPILTRPAESHGRRKTRRPSATRTPPPTTKNPKITRSLLESKSSANSTPTPNPRRARQTKTARPNSAVERRSLATERPYHRARRASLLGWTIAPSSLSSVSGQKRCARVSHQASSCQEEWSLIEPSAGNASQPPANRLSTGTAKTSQNRCRGSRPLAVCAVPSVTHSCP